MSDAMKIVNSFAEVDAETANSSGWVGVDTVEALLALYKHFGRKLPPEAETYIKNYRNKDKVFILNASGKSTAIEPRSYCDQNFANVVVMYVQSSPIGGMYD